MANDDPGPGRTFRLPQWIWDELDRDAITHHRSAVKQLQALLEAYYRGVVHAIEPERVNAAADIASPRRGHLADSAQDSVPVNIKRAKGGRIIGKQKREEIPALDDDSKPAAKKRRA